MLESGRAKAVSGGVRNCGIPVAADGSGRDLHFRRSFYGYRSRRITGVRQASTIAPVRKVAVVDTA